MSRVGDRIAAVVRAGLAPPLKAAGFRKAGHTFRRPFPLGVQVVNVQSSLWNSSDGGRFTVNLGVYLPAVAPLDGFPARPNPAHYHCQLSERIGFLLPDLRDHWWELTADSDDAAIAAELGRAWEHAGPGWFAARDRPAGVLAAAGSPWVGCKLALALGDRTTAVALWREARVGASGSFAATAEAFAREHGLLSSAAIARPRANPS